MTFLMTLLQQDDGSGGGIGGIIGLIIGIAILVALWRLFTKAGYPGWVAIIPIYNMYILLKIAGKSAWWLLVFCIPVVNIIFFILTYLAAAKSFNKSTSMA